LKILGANKEACASLRIALSFSPTDRAIRNELAALEFVFLIYTNTHALFD
jgi:hypothetical protein